MKKILALLLTVSLLLGVTVLSVSAEEIPREDFEAAIIETAMAYYNKGLPIQYDSNPWTIQSKNDWGGACRLTSGAAPEEGSSDYTIYSVCSDWCYDVYHNAFGYELMEIPRLCRTAKMLAVPASDKLVAYKYDPTGADTDAMKDLDTAITTARDGLQVGDVIVGYGSTGHAMLYIGDYKGDGTRYVIHCWGGKFDGNTGVDTIETNVRNANPEGGAIRIDDVMEVFSEPSNTNTGVWNLRKATCGSEGFTVLRPYQTDTLSLTDSARVRLQYRGLEVNKETDLSRYRSPETGRELTLTVTVTNNGTEDYTGLTVTEPLPTGAVLTDAGGGNVADGQITWTFDVSAGGKVELSYTVTVTARRGETVTFPRGDVGGGLPTRMFTMKVCGRKLPEEIKDRARALRDGTLTVDAADYLQTDDPIEFANKIYANVLGVPLELPTNLSSYMTGLCKRKTVGGVAAKFGGWMWQPKTAVEDDWQRIRDMIVPDHLVGYSVYLDDSPDAPRDDWSATNRVQEYKRTSYEIGDIFIALSDPDIQTVSDQKNVLVFVNLGGGKVAVRDDTVGARVVNFSDTVARFYNKNFILVLRPTLAYDDVAAGKLRVMAGDLTGDDAVGMKDVLHLRQVIAGGYDAEADALAADLNRDGQINMRDLLTLRQHLAGGYGIVLE
ncbi:MAG: DUF11 domain-containing protein [Oscillospiraceae bacterium]|nr:DUF11 domain-containing protein [Oscillospiraceae bacterium]